MQNTALRRTGQAFSASSTPDTGSARVIGMISVRMRSFGALRLKAMFSFR